MHVAWLQSTVLAQVYSSSKLGVRLVGPQVRVVRNLVDELRSWSLLSVVNHVQPTVSAA